MAPTLGCQHHWQKEARNTQAQRQPEGQLSRPQCLDWVVRRDTWVATRGHRVNTQPLSVTLQVRKNTYHRPWESLTTVKLFWGPKILSLSCLGVPPPKCFGFSIFHLFWSLNLLPPMFLGLNHPSLTYFSVSITHLPSVLGSQCPITNLFWGLNFPPPICFVISTSHLSSVLGSQSPTSHLFWVSITKLSSVLGSQMKLPLQTYFWVSTSQFPSISGLSLQILLFC